MKNDFPFINYIHKIKKAYIYTYNLTILWRHKENDDFCKKSPVGIDIA